MFDKQDLTRLLDAMRAHGVGTLEIEGGDMFLRLVLPAGPAPAAAAQAQPATATAAARSPDIGRFLPRGSDDGLPVLAPGDAVRTGELLGYVAQGAVRAALTAPADGTIASQIPESGTLFGHGDTVLTLETKP
ncbi:hypothetical protein NM680_11965 [Paracoccus sp. PS-1]|uniref:hypothetical protein n=1 Tax=unclassified Paracoccus (in: a-proteobacteria) TaxID=2688777 RepID=UPI00048C671D|nr:MULTISPECIES: hypothetical protein [unclassified Paracoccus (in: a-proteobacteria)]MDQ7262511.1 hypothetical protein [Paracoccus sp. PS1]